MRRNACPSQNGVFGRSSPAFRPISISSYHRPTNSSVLTLSRNIYPSARFEHIAEWKQYFEGGNFANPLPQSRAFTPSWQPTRLPRLFCVAPVALYVASLRTPVAMASLSLSRDVRLLPSSEPCHRESETLREEIQHEVPRSFSVARDACVL